MAEFERFSVLLPRELAKLVHDAVDGKQFAVESDVFIDALEGWRIKQTIRREKLQRLRGMIEEGIASGSEPMAEDEADQIIREGRASLARNAAE